MRSPLLTLAAGCSALFGIIIFCVIFGGYSSFSRAQARIVDSKSLVANACQTKLDLLPELFEITRKSTAQPSIPAINQAAEKASLILQEVMSLTPPLEKQLIKEYELTQIDLTQQLKVLFSQLETSSDKEQLQQFAALKKRFNLAQDNLFVLKKQYNTEVLYFNTRTKTFPNFLIAKIFGFDKIEYTELSDEVFLPARKTFEIQTQ